MQDSVSLGQKIKNFRKRAGMSQFDLEIQIGASPGSLSRIENGEVNPTKETLFKIVDALELKAVESWTLFNMSFRELAKIAEISKNLSSSFDLDEILQNAVNDISIKLDLNGVIIFLIKGGSIYTKAITDSPETRLAMKIMKLKNFNLNIPLNKKTNNLVVNCIRDRKAYFSTDLKDFTLDVLNGLVTDLCARVTEFKSGIVLPLILNNKVIGAIFFSKYYEESFNNEMPILEILRDHVVTSISNLEKYNELQKRLAKEINL